ncbi:MAG: pyridoxamine 5'-phosphate oxidase family protein [Minisyncoccia bacterium]
MIASLMLACSVLAAATPEEKAVYDLAKRGNVASLATDYKGTPFGSLVAYVLDKEGRPIMFLSDMAQHTKNMKKKRKVSLMVSKEDADPFNSARITFLGKVKKLDGDAAKEARQLFLDKYKDNVSWFIDELDDFHYYRVETSSIYYIGGFGEIRWIELEDYKAGFKK